jgi:hypothetical protein
MAAKGSPQEVQAAFRLGRDRIKGIVEEVIEGPTA